MPKVVTLDNRGLEPPEPMVRTLEKATTLADDEVLEVLNDRRPRFLYPHLDQRGFWHETVDLPDGSVKITIARHKP